MAARGVFALAALLLLSACATSENAARSEADPWEPLNRGIYAVNDVPDRFLLKPIARGYRAITPVFLRRGVSNFFDNLTTPRSALNNFLQGKPKRGFSDVSRFLFNSTIGVGGLIDVASMGGLEIYDEDFGQTLAVWGVPDGPYIVIPLLGPSTLRDGVALPVDIYSSLLTHIDDSSVRDKLWGLRLIDLRARLLTAEQLIEDSRDPYITIRESFLQNRRFQVYDGDPPIDEDFYDDFEDFEDFEDPDGEAAEPPPED
ncbi:MAG: VacJ family lipoprotein [Woeseiaceae bacterium]|nr:VacJ family lipoprotein [Woeseiaceae bacterium]